ncbi:MAG: endolytic transglycosylase MltG [Candidatus Limnocylindrales bacterium]|nr:endolytic transglycosylase MltG [Candidatus Limnocylindrales bacterium]
MTIRSGRRPRDARELRARPFDPDAYATEPVDDNGEPPRLSRGDGGGSRGSGLIGLVKFLVFALVLAGVVLIAALTALRPVVNSVILDLAQDNPAALQLPFVKDIVRQDLGRALTDPVSSDSTQVEFVVEEGDTARSIADLLEADGLLADSRAFIFIAIDRQLSGSLRVGDYVLRRNLTPDQLVSALLDPPVITYVDISLRTGLRLEQITAKLQTLGDLDMDPKDFYDLVTSPPAALIADYPWLETIREGAPEGASLEGFVWPATYRVRPDTTPEELVRLMLDKFVANMGEERIDVTRDRGLNFYQVMALASIVEREAVLDDERPLIAGVYQNRIDGIAGVKTRLLNADPTVFYAIDTMELDKLPFAEWQRYAFWTPPGVALADVAVPEALQGFQTYQTPGLIPAPICTPSLPSIDAALEPDTADKYIYFLAIPDGGGTHAFATTKAEHDANRKKYGYIQ